MSKPTTVPLEITTKLDVDMLKLDFQNPRLIGINNVSTSDEKIIAQLYRGEELAELLQSIAANGYLDIEPLIVCFDESDQKYIVLEGNRRLAAIRLFREPKLIEKIHEAEHLKISIPKITDKTRKTLDEVSVYRVPDRDSARSYIGFKHINGAAKWESYAKARFAADWYKSKNASLEEIAAKIGDRHDTIKRMVAAIYVLEQAEEAGLFSLSDRNTLKFNFSHLYTALSRAPYMDFLGLRISWSRYDPKPNPIPKENQAQLKEILTWIYGSKSDHVQPLIQSQNPDIKRLSEVLTNSEGLHILRNNGTLTEAHASTRSVDATFSAALLNARSSLRDAVNSLRGYDGEDSSLLSIAEDIRENIETILERMKKKYSSTNLGE